MARLRAGAAFQKKIRTTNNLRHSTIHWTGPILLEFIVGDPIHVNEA